MALLGGAGKERQHDWPEASRTKPVPSHTLKAHKEANRLMIRVFIGVLISDRMTNLILMQTSVVLSWKRYYWATPESWPRGLPGKTLREAPGGESILHPFKPSQKRLHPYFVRANRRNKPSPANPATRSNAVLPPSGTVGNARMMGKAIALSANNKSPATTSTI